MGKWMLMGLAALLCGCTSTGQPRTGVLVGAVAIGALMLVAGNGDDEDDESDNGVDCYTALGGGRVCQTR